MLKNKNVQIALGVILLVVVGLGGFYFFANKSSAKPEQQQAVDTSVQHLDAKEIGLTLVVSPDKKKVKVKIDKASDIKGLEYELLYDADVPRSEQVEGGENTVTRQVSGDAKIESGNSSYESDWIDLGSCSKNVCKYDTGVKTISITLKLTKTNNKIYEIESKLDL